MTPLELKEQKKQLDQLLAISFIRLSTSHWRAFVIFVKKYNEILRLCMDYKKLNRVTVKNRYPIPQSNGVTSTTLRLIFVVCTSS